MTIAESLKRFRKEFNLSQKEVAAQLDMIPQSYCRYETGQYSPRADDIIKLAMVYDISADYLLGLSDNPKPSGINEREVTEARALRKALKKFVEENNL